jgi:hypothetical protein
MIDSTQKNGPLSTVTPRGPYVPVLADTQDRRETVREQLDRILASSVFRNSRRYASVLRYIVERSLDGTAESLKERIIGIEVFGRAPDYDTTTDHAVRSAVAEIRKRLAQYYLDEGAEADLRIEVQPGSYAPQFRQILDSPARADVDQASPVELKEEAPVAVAQLNWSHRPKIARIVYATLAIAAVAVAALFLGWHQDPLASFWRPMFSSRDRILICIGTLAGGHKTPPPGQDSKRDEQTITLKEFHSLEKQTVHIADAITLSRFAGLLEARGKSYQVASQSEANFADLQNGPVILIGLLNNEWTKRVVGQLRFSVEKPDPGKVLIRDRDNPSQHDWFVDYYIPYLDVSKDYALVLRVLDPKTDQMVVTAAGISVFGTLAAAEFLTGPDELKKLSALAPRGWERMNVEIVLSTDVIRGKSGRPHIAATHFW